MYDKYATMCLTMVELFSESNTALPTVLLSSARLKQRDLEGVWTSVYQCSAVNELL